MAVPGLPSADSLFASLAALRRRLISEEVAFRASTFSARSTDLKATVTTNGMVEVLSVVIEDSAWPPPSAAALAPSLREAAAQSLARANADTRPKAATNAAGYTLTGIPNSNQPQPAVLGFPSAEADFTTLLRAQDPLIAAKKFQGASGSVLAEVDGTLALVRLEVGDPLTPARTDLETDVVTALNLALEKAKRLFEQAVNTRVHQGVDPGTISSPAACLWAHGSLQIADRAKIKRQDGSFAPIVNAGATQTNIGVQAQTGDLWSRASVVLRDRSQVNGSLRTRGTLARGSNTVVTGTITEDGFVIQIPNLSLPVTFPGTNQGAINVPPDQTRTLVPGAFATVTVNSRATLFLSKGTYYFDSFQVEPQATISCTSGSGPVIVYVKNSFTFRGAIIEKTGGRPKFFIDVLGSNQVSLGAPFTGTLVALNALVDFATVGAPGHSGAFYAKNITVQPDNTITHFPFSGPPTLIPS